MSQIHGPIDLELRAVSKRFGTVEAVVDCSFIVGRGETLALLGPSGCGKSTLLNIIAGFEHADRGTVQLRDQAIENLPPNRREVGLVFQHYALFPHLSVRENVAYGLRARRLPRATIDERVAEMIELLKLQALEGRYPAALSGGQRQRVAVARALAIRPAVLLLDEALSALDKNLREQMQVELSLLLRRLDITTILVTHDQREAFTMGHRIAVMEAGRLVQVGTPDEIYARPSSSFVLEFVGSANCLLASVEDTNGGAAVVTPTGLVFRVPVPRDLPSNPRLRVYVRAEDVRLSATPTPTHAKMPARVALMTFLGAVRRYVVLLEGLQIVAEVPASLPGPAQVGDEVFLDVAAERCHLVVEK